MRWTIAGSSSSRRAIEPLAWRLSVSARLVIAFAAPLPTMVRAAKAAVFATSAHDAPSAMAANAPARLQLRVPLSAMAWPGHARLRPTDQYLQVLMPLARPEISFLLSRSRETDRTRSARVLWLAFAQATVAFAPMIAASS